MAVRSRGSSSGLRGARSSLAVLSAIALLAGVGGCGGRSAAANGPPAREHDVTVWSPPGTPPLSDHRAAALVTARPENRPANEAANGYVPTTGQLASFHAAEDRIRGTVNFNPLTRYVTGRPGLADPSTDELIQWVSHKWGIPTNWIRAQMVAESDWDQAHRGDLAKVSASWYRQYPALERVAGTNMAYESVGIAQVRWLPDNSIGPGTRPLSYESTAFNLDYYAATVRYFFDGDCRWCSSGYSAGQRWNSIGAWFSPQPWMNSGAREYIHTVQSELAQQVWRDRAF
jgi:hypothetical protein